MDIIKEKNYEKDKMAGFMDLFDPTLCDEPITDDLEELLSASALLEQQPKRPNLPPRSKTTLDLTSHFRAHHEGQYNTAMIVNNQHNLSFLQKWPS